MESGAAAAAGEGETENETREAGASEYTETAQLEPEKEEPKGPRPTASVPVPGIIHCIVCFTTVCISKDESAVSNMVYPSHYCTGSRSLLAYLQ